MTALTRKTFSTVAAKLHQYRPESRNGDEYAGWQEATIAVASAFSSLAPSFDMGRFLTAAGLSDEEVRRWKAAPLL